MKPIALTLALTALVLRIAVPAGLMPADGSSGWHLQLCPNGIPTAVMAGLLDDPHLHHHHDHHQSFEQCDLGSALGVMAATGFNAVDKIDEPTRERYFATRVDQAHFHTRFTRPPRAPPHTLS